MSGNPSQIEWRLTRTARARLTADGIALVEILPNIQQTTQDAIENLEMAVSIRPGKVCPLLVDLRGALPLEPEARHVYSGDKVNVSFSALSMLVNKDPLSRMMMSVYLGRVRLAIPVKVYDDPDKAINWLKSHASG